MALFTNAEVNAAAEAAIVPSTTYKMSLHTGSPGTTGANEATGGSYARQNIAFGSASAGVVTSTSSQAFTGLTNTTTVTYFGIWTSGGTYMGGGPTGSSYSSGTTWELDFAIGAVTVTVSS